jgi:hypothetical protein
MLLLWYLKFVKQAFVLGTHFLLSFCFIESHLEVYIFSFFFEILSLWLYFFVDEK